jgi:eukaryotic-like serine/threonine-protein kinase
MQSEYWRRVEALYHRVLELEESARAEFLRDVCSDDDRLRREIESLLACDNDARDFLEDQEPPVAQSWLGRQVGSYKVLSLVGAGGMGEVYRAHDTKLGRDVGIKVLPSRFSEDAGRLGRLRREARLLASLSHPNIAAIYGLEEFEGAPCVVMEFVGGVTLAEMLSFRRLDIPEALKLAAQIAHALEAAHEKGIIHRDLKPANIKITPDDKVKVLDFGLAKPVTEEVASPATLEGIILGTPAFMSPEQARGKTVDSRTDVWAFGCVLYEMLCGRPAFAESNVTDTIAAVVGRDPDWPALPDATPPSIRSLLRRCLQKEASRRWHHMSDVRIELEEAIAAFSSPREISGEVPSLTKHGWQRTVSFIAVAVLIAATGSIAWRVSKGNASRTTTAIGPLTRLTADATFTTDPSISADGQLVAYASDRSGDGNLDIYVQQSAGGPPIRLTTDPTDDHEPDVSPDGRLIAFRSERNGGGVYVIPALGGDARLIAPNGRSPRFSPDGKSIAFWTGRWTAPRNLDSARKTYVIAVTGGEAVPVAAGFYSAGDAVWAPDGKALLLLAWQTSSAEDAQTDWWWVPLDKRAPVRTGAFAQMSASGIRTAYRLAAEGAALSDLPRPQDWMDDAVLFAASTGNEYVQHIWEIPITPATGSVHRPPRQVTAGPSVDVSPRRARDGRLVFSSVTNRNVIVGVPLDANAARATGALRYLRSGAVRTSRPSASQDGSTLVFPVLLSGGAEVWIKDLHTDRDRQLAVTAAENVTPVISRDGRWVGYTVRSMGQGGAGAGEGYIISAAAAGAPRKVCAYCEIMSWLSGDRRLLIHTAAGAVAVLAIQTGEQLPVVSAGIRTFVSPDERWIAFSNTRGTFVAPFRPGNPPSQDEWIRIIDTRDDGRATGWSPDSRFLYLLLDHDGFPFCLHAVRIARDTGKKEGDVIPVYHFHNPKLRWGSTGFASAVVSGLFVADQQEYTGDIWLTTLLR